MESIAWSDPLTGVLNRRGFERDAAQRLTDSADDATGALLFIDLNEFKDINDKHGHVVGDQLLTIAAQRLRKSLRSQDIIGRPGGDEFVALVPDVSAAVADKLAKRLAQSLEAPYNIGAETMSCAASIGLALYPTNANTLTGLLREADQAMYRAKARTRGAAELSINSAQPRSASMCPARMTRYGYPFRKTTNDQKDAARPLRNHDGDESGLQSFHSARSCRCSGCSKRRRDTAVASRKGCAPLYRRDRRRETVPLRAA
jgi:diguanylate cyclase (GGDEF)-like protein